MLLTLQRRYSVPEGLKWLGRRPVQVPLPSPHQLKEGLSPDLI